MKPVYVKNTSVVKVTRHLPFKNYKNLPPQDILAFNSANKPSFQNLMKSFLSGFEKLLY